MSLPHRWSHWEQFLYTPEHRTGGAGRVSEPLIRNAYEFNNVIFTAARLPQIIQNFRVRGIPSLVP